MNRKKGDVRGLLKVLRTWPDGCTFNRLKLPTEFRDKWVMNDLVRQGFLVDKGDELFQRTGRKNAYHKRKFLRKPITSTFFTGKAGRAFEKIAINNPVRTAEIFEMRVGKGEVPASYQQIADRFNISRQRVGQILTKSGVAGRVALRDPKYLTTTEASKYLGVSYKSVRDWAITGTLPFYQKRVTHNGKVTRLLFRREDLDTYKQQKLLTPRRNHKENQGLKPLVIRLLQLGDHPQEIAKLSGVGITTVYNWMYQMPGRDKRVGVAMEKILSGDKMTLANLPNSATGE